MGARGGGLLSLARQTLSAGRSARCGRRPAGGRAPVGRRGRRRLRCPSPSRHLL